MVDKITKREAKIAAKLYIASLFSSYDDFNTQGLGDGGASVTSDEVDGAIQDEIDKIISRLLANLDHENIPTTSLECILMAKKLVKIKKGLKNDRYE